MESLSILLSGQFQVPPRDGMSVRSWEFARNLAAMGHRMTILCARRWPSEPFRETRDGVEILRALELRWPNRWMAASMVPDGILRGLTVRADLLQAILHLGMFTVLPIRALRRIPLVFDDPDFFVEGAISSGLIRRGSAPEKFLSFVERYNHMAPDAILVISEEMARYIARQERVPLDKFNPIPNGVNREMFHERVDGSEIRARINPDGKIVIHEGLLAHWANVGGVFEAFRYVVDRDPTVKFLMVGGGEELERLKQKAAAMGLSSHVVFTGHLPYAEVPRYIAASDMSVLTLPNMGYTDSALPFKVIESLSCGVPVLATWGLTLKRVLDGNGCGHVADGEDPQTYGKRMLEMLQHEDLKSMGQRGARYAKENHDWKIVTRNLVNVYRKVLAER